MNHRRGTEQRSGRSLPLIGVIALLLAALATDEALAHPLDEYPRATYITVAPTQIVVELDLPPGVPVAPRVLPLLDPDGTQTVTDAEGRAYVVSVLRNVVLQVDGQPQALVVTRIEMPPYLNFRAGYGLICIFALATPVDGTTGTHQISYANN